MEQSTMLMLISVMGFVVGMVMCFLALTNIDGGTKRWFSYLAAPGIALVIVSVIAFLLGAGSYLLSPQVIHL